MPDPNSPLNDAHLQQIRNALDAVKAAKSQIEMAKSAGIAPDKIAELEQANNDNESKLRQIKQVYFPGQ